LVDGGLLGVALPIAERLARVLDPDAEVGGRTA
jgi:hypothetical protein